MWGRCPGTGVGGTEGRRGALTVGLGYARLPLLLLLSLVQLQGVLHSDSPGLVMNHRLWGFLVYLLMISLRAKY